MFTYICLQFSSSTLALVASLKIVLLHPFSEIEGTEAGNRSEAMVGPSLTVDELEYYKTELFSERRIQFWFLTLEVGRCKTIGAGFLLYYLQIFAPCPWLACVLYSGLWLYKEVKYGQVTQGSMNFHPILSQMEQSRPSEPRLAHSSQQTDIS